MSKDVKILAAIAVVVIAGAVIGANYYRTSRQSERITPASNAGANSNKPAVSTEQLIRPDSATLGPSGAPITLVEFYDPECESCASFAPAVKQILKDYEGKIRLVSRYMPLHPNSIQAGTLTEAAGEQGKFWEMQDLLFKRQSEWGTPHGPQPAGPPPNIDALFEKYARELGLDIKKVNAATKSGGYQAKLERDRKDGQSLGVRMTPTFFVNGRQLMRFGERELRSLIDEELTK